MVATNPVPTLQDLTIRDLAGTGLEEDEAQELLQLLHEVLAAVDQPPEQVWRAISKTVLSPCHPFALHRLLLAATYAVGWDEAERGRPPVWVPTPEGAALTNLASFMRNFQGGDEWSRHATGDPLRDLPLLQRISALQPEAYWPPLLRHLRVHFHHPPSRVLEVGPSADACRWLPGARLNIAESCLRGRDPDAPAIMWAPEDVPTQVHTVSYGALTRAARACAASLRAMGLRAGDAVGVVLPMGPRAVAAYLGIVLAGCAVVAVAESFAAEEVAARMRLARAVAVVTQDVVLRGGKALPLYSRVTTAAAPRTVVLPASGATPAAPLRAGDLAWGDFLAAGARGAGGFRAHVASPDDVTAVLFSSGTSGEPKAIPWTHVTPIKCAADAWAHQDVRAGDVVAWPSSLGWMMGSWLVYATLLNGATMALFQGAPQGRPFGQFVAAARVTCLGVVPSLVKAWRASDCMAGLDWSSLRCYSSTGEASAPEDSHWLSARGGYVPVIEYCGGTEIGGAFLTGTLLQPAVPATFCTPAMGTRLALLGPQGDLSTHGSGDCVAGELVLAAPALGLSQRLLNRDHEEAYYKGMPAPPCRGVWLRRHGDEVARLPGGYYAALGRVDDTMNLGGIKVSSVELERCVVGAVPGVVEAAAVGVPTPGGGPEQLVLFLVLQRGASLDADAARLAAQQALRAHLNPLFRVHGALLRPLLPRNASNKVMRRLLRDELVAQRQSKL